MPAIPRLICALLLPLASPAFAWNRGGHMVSASIAFDVLKQDDPAALARVLDVRRKPPQYAESARYFASSTDTFVVRVSFVPEMRIPSFAFFRYVPAGNFTTPPPACSAASSARAIASGYLVFPSPLAPYSVTRNGFSGICGRAGSAILDVVGVASVVAYCAPARDTTEQSIRNDETLTVPVLPQQQRR